MVLFCLRPAATHAARALGLGLLERLLLVLEVVVLELLVELGEVLGVAFLERRVLEGLVGEAEVVGRGAARDLLLAQDLVLVADDARGAAHDRVDVTAGRRCLLARAAVAAALLLAFGTALSLPLLGPLTVARHRAPSEGPRRGRRRPRTRSSRLLVRRMRLAPAAVLAELDPVRIVPLGLLCLVVASLALFTSERHADSDVSACHCSSKLLVRAQRWRRKTSPGSARLGGV